MTMHWPCTFGPTLFPPVEVALASCTPAKARPPSIAATAARRARAFCRPFHRLAQRRSTALATSSSGSTAGPATLEVGGGSVSDAVPGSSVTSPGAAETSPLTPVSTRSSTPRVSVGAVVSAAVRSWIASPTSTRLAKASTSPAAMATKTMTATNPPPPRRRCWPPELRRTAVARCCWLDDVTMCGCGLRSCWCARAFSAACAVGDPACPDGSRGGVEPHFLQKLKSPASFFVPQLGQVQAITRIPPSRSRSHRRGGRSANGTARRTGLRSPAGWDQLASSPVAAVARPTTHGRYRRPR